jgi:hypothetical protein
LTPADCATGTPFPAFAFDSYLTFGADGTLIEATSNANFQPGQRSAGHGYWERSGHASYAAVFQAFIQFDSAARFRGTQRVDTTLRLIDTDRWQGRAAIAFTNVAGVEYSTGCAIIDAVRLS